MAVVPAGKLAADVGLGVIGTVMAVCTQQRDDEATCMLLSEAMVVTRAWPQCQARAELVCAWCRMRPDIDRDSTATTKVQSSSLLVLV